MIVKRIVSNISAASPEEAEEFYSAIFGLRLVMNHGWIRTYSSGVDHRVSFREEGSPTMTGSGLSGEISLSDASYP